MREQKFNVSGMSCAACSAHVEKAVCSVAGVSSAVVNLLSGSVMVSMSDDVSFQDIITAVEKAGYTASLPRAAASAAPAASTADSATAAAREEITLLKRRLIFSIVLLVPLMYLSMGHMFGAPLPQLLSNPASNALAQLLLAAVVMLVNQRFFVNGWRGLRHGAPNMDTLVALGSGASYVYSVAVLFLLVQAACLQDSALVQQYAHGFYFEAAAMIVTLITVGKLLEAVSKGHTTDALFALMQLQPQQAHIIKDGREQTVAVEQVQVGDIFVVRPAEKIPVDGIVSQGSSAVDESALTVIAFRFRQHDPVIAPAIQHPGRKPQQGHCRDCTRFILAMQQYHGTSGGSNSNVNCLNVTEQVSANGSRGSSTDRKPHQLTHTITAY